MAVTWQWPPDRESLKLDLGQTGSAKDDQLDQVLAAAVSEVERVKSGAFNFAGDLGSTLPDPATDRALILGTLRLAGRWHARRRTADGEINSDTFGSLEMGSGDPDIDRMLRVGAFSPPVVA